MAQPNNKLDQSLIEFVTRLQEKNDIELQVPKANIDTVLDNPEQYALDFIEAEFGKYVESFVQSYKLGKKFGKELIKNGKEIKNKTDI